jgi:hypothetical protein
MITIVWPRAATSGIDVATRMICSVSNDAKASAATEKKATRMTRNR